MLLCIQVGLAGPSGSGKTAFSQKVQDFLPGEREASAVPIAITLFHCSY